eukprot:gene19074-24899_t
MSAIDSHKLIKFQDNIGVTIDPFINNSDEDNLFDYDYENLLNLDKALDSESRSLVISQNELIGLSDPVTEEFAINDEAKKKKNERFRWPNWDSKMETFFHDIDDELTEEDAWLQPVRDYIEQKRGKAIWSKKSDQEIQREIKKNQASKGLYIPSFVIQVVTALYLDKSHKWQEYKLEDELACIEYRKWVNQQKKKSKKNPIQVAKLEVSKSWLLLHPSQSNALRPQKPRKMPPINKKKIKDLLMFRRKPATLTVMDDIAVYPNYQSINNKTISFDSIREKAAAAATTKSQRIEVPSRSNNSTISAYQSTSGWAPIVTSSMTNWDKKFSELPASELAAYTRDAFFDNEFGSIDPTESRKDRDKRNISFVIDDHQMFLPNNCNDEYFVVI